MLKLLFNDSNKQIGDGVSKDPHCKGLEALEGSLENNPGHLCKQQQQQQQQQQPDISSVAAGILEKYSRINKTLP